MNHALLAYNSRDRWGPDTVNRCRSLTVETLRGLPFFSLSLSLSSLAFYYDRLDFRSREQRPGQRILRPISVDRSTFARLEASISNIRSARRILGEWSIGDARETIDWAILDQIWDTFEAQESLDETRGNADASTSVGNFRSRSPSVPVGG